MALIDKETIRKEIERRLSWRITLEARAAYNNILRFLDTLPEQPVEGLEEAACEYVEELDKKMKAEAGSNFDEDVAYLLTRLYIAGAEWAAENAKK